MKNIRNTTLCLLCFFGIGMSCTKDFKEINANPNVPESVDPQFLLANVISIAADRNAYEQSFRLSNYLAQFAASVEFERIDRYEMGSNSGYWNTIFRLLSDIKTMKEAPNSNEAYQAVGSIMESYLFSQLTDLWGDVPYSDAVKALDGNYTPKYDTQQEIYTNPETGILAVLRKSAATLETTPERISGDVMFNNNLDAWVRFANSLRVRYIMRISDKITDFSELKTLVSSGKLMRNNADNAVVPYLAAAPNQWPMSLAALGLYQEHRMTQTVDSVMTLWKDPRVAVLYKPTQKSVIDGNPTYKGLLNGQDRETISKKNINLNDISLFGTIFRDVPNGVNAQFMQYSELQFALAEAAQKGYITGNVNDFYEKGVRASFDYYKTAVPATYFSNPAVALTDNQLNKILTQKWLSLIGVGHEAWFLIRRTGIPAIKPGPDNLNEGRYPVRYTYPESEQATNSANYKAASERIGGDNINSKSWWEKK